MFSTLLSTCPSRLALARISYKAWVRPAVPEYEMDNTALAEYADKIPLVVKAGFKGLADDGALGIAVALMEDGNMTFSELKSRFGLNSSTLSRHLAALQRGDLVRNYYEKRDGRPYSYYEATSLPGVLLNAVYIALREEAEEGPAGTLDRKPAGVGAVSLRDATATALVSVLAQASDANQDRQQEIVHVSQSAYWPKTYLSIKVRAT